jgi:hypothetical protein
MLVEFSGSSIVTGFYSSTAEFVHDMASKGVVMQEVSNTGSLSKVCTHMASDPFPHGPGGTCEHSKKEHGEHSKHRGSIGDADDQRGRKRTVSFAGVRDTANADCGSDRDSSNDTTATEDVRSLEDIISRHPAHKKERVIALAAAAATAGTTKPVEAAADVILVCSPGNEEEQALQEEAKATLIDNFVDMSIGSTYRDVTVRVAPDFEYESLQLMASSHVAIVGVSQSFCEMLGNLDRHKDDEVFVDTIAGWICLLVIQFMVEIAKTGHNKQSTALVMCYAIDAEGGGDADGEGTGNRSDRSVSTPQALLPSNTPGNRRSLPRNASVFTPAPTPAQAALDIVSDRGSPNTPGSVKGMGMSDNSNSSSSVQAQSPRVRAAAPPTLHLSKILFHCDCEPVSDDTHRASFGSVQPGSASTGGIGGIGGIGGSTRALSQIFSAEMLRNMEQEKAVRSIKQAVEMLQNHMGLPICKDTWTYISELTLLKVAERIFSSSDAEMETAMASALGQTVSRDTDSDKKKRLSDLTVDRVIALFDNSGLQSFISTVAINKIDGQQLDRMEANLKRIFPEFHTDDVDRLKTHVTRWRQSGILVLEGEMHLPTLPFIE